jgi:HTH-type transcriptional regulator / antitoxin HigA
MVALKYTVIKNDKQCDKYCDKLEYLLDNHLHDNDAQDEIELLTVLIEVWDNAHSTLKILDPVEMLKSEMEEHGLRAIDLANFLQVSKGYVSDILNYKKGFSKTVTRKLSERFSVNQKIFNRPYKLKK